MRVAFRVMTGAGRTYFGDTMRNMQNNGVCPRSITILVSARSVASLDLCLSGLAFYARQLALNSKVGVHLRLAEKTGGRLETILEPHRRSFNSVETYVRSSEESLIDSIVFLSGTIVLGDESWVQIVADDDVVFPAKNLSVKPHRETQMTVPEIALVGKRVSLVTGPEKRVTLEDIGLSLAAGIEGDKSWHGLVRTTVFLQYIEWLKALGAHPHVVSNGLVWAALALGHVSTLEGFVYVKETSFYDSQAGVARREHDSQRRLFGARIGGLEKSLIHISNTSLLLFFANSHESKEMHYILNFHLKLWLQSLGHTISERMMRGCQESKISPGVNAALLNKCIHRTETMFGSVGREVLRCFPLVAMDTVAESSPGFTDF